MSQKLVRIFSTLYRVKTKRQEIKMRAVTLLLIFCIVYKMYKKEMPCTGIFHCLNPGNHYMRSILLYLHSTRRVKEKLHKFPVLHLFSQFEVCCLVKGRSLQKFTLFHNLELDMHVLKNWSHTTKHFTVAISDMLWMTFCVKYF